MKAVIPYLGPKIPKYVEDNVNQINSTLGTQNVVFLTDKNFRGFRSSFDKVEIWRSKSSENILENISSLLNDSVNKNQSLFWQYTIARFLLIQEFMEDSGECPILQIEADVWIAPNFPLGAFEKIDNKIAFPLQSLDKPVPSLLYFRDVNSINFLNQFIMNHLSRGQMIDDYDLLNLMYQKYPDLIEILPTTFGASDGFHSHVDTQAMQKMKSGVSKFGGIFDASTWGQYLVGEDARNTHGFKRSFYLQTWHSVNPRVFQFKVVPSEGVLVQSHAEEKFLFNLHVHSKDSRIFKGSGLDFVQNQLRILKRKNSSHYVFSPQAFANIVLSIGLKAYTKALLRFIKQKIVNRLNE